MEESQTLQLLKQIERNTRVKDEEELIVQMTESDYDYVLTGSGLELYDGHYKMGVTYLNVYNSVFNITTANNNFRYSPDNQTTWFDLTIDPGAYEITAINDEIKRQMEVNGHTKNNPSEYDDYYIHLEANDNTQKSIIIILDTNYSVDLTPSNSLASLLGFVPRILTGSYNTSENKVDIISFNNVFIYCDIVRGAYWNGKRTHILHSFSLNVSPGFRFVDKFYGGISYKDIINSKEQITLIKFYVRDDNGKALDFQGEVLTFKVKIIEK